MKSIFSSSIKIYFEQALCAWVIMYYFLHFNCWIWISNHFFNICNGIQMRPVSKPICVLPRETPFTVCSAVWCLQNIASRCVRWFEDSTQQNTQWTAFHVAKRQWDLKLARPHFEDITNIEKMIRYSNSVLKMEEKMFYNPRLVIKQKPCFSEVCHQKLEMHLIMLIIYT